MREWNEAVTPGELDCFFVQPDEDVVPTGAVIVAHEVWGLDDHIRDVTRRVAREGYLAVAPNLYTRKPRPPGETIAELHSFMFAFPDRQAVGDMEATLSFLKSRFGADLPVAAMGFCIGGTWCRMLSTRANAVAGCIDFYGRLRYPKLTDSKPRQPWDYVAQMKAPYLGLFGEDDPVIPPEDIEKLRSGLRQAGIEHKVEVISGAPHAFFNDSRPLYQERAATTAWDEVRTFLSRTLN